MESGKKAVVIIIVAMMLTAGIGFLFNFEKDEKHKVAYDKLGNLDAIISVNSGRTNESEIYNPTTNVTGWYPTLFYNDSDEVIGGIPTSNTTSPYVIVPNKVGGSTTDKTTTVSTYTPHYRENADSLGRFTTPRFISNVDNVALRMGEGYNDFWNYTIDNLVAMYTTKYAEWYGGYGEQYHSSTQTQGPGGTVHTLTVDDYLNYNLKVGDTVTNSATYSNGEYISFVPLSALLPANTVLADDAVLGFSSKPVLCVNGSRTIDTNTTSTGTVNTDRTRTTTYTVTYSCTELINASDYDNLIFSTDDNMWKVMKNGYVTGRISPANTYVYATNANAQWVTSYTVYEKSSAVYADPTKYVSIPAGETSEWSNTVLHKDGHLETTTLIDSQASMLVKGKGDISVYSVDISTTPYVFTLAFTLHINKDGAGYSIAINNSLPTLIGPYIGLRITLSQLTNSILVQGILTDESGEHTANTPTYNYTLADVRYNLAIPSGVTIPYIGKLVFTASSSDTFYGYIDETYVLSDPNQALWADIDVNLQQYFPGQQDNLRVLLQGFVKYGTELKINNQTFTVNDGKITYVKVEYDDNNVVTQTTPYTFQLNGLAIDYRGGHVYLSQTNGNTEVDIGTRTTFQIVMEGVWYFSSSAYSIRTYLEEVDVWSPGWSLNMDATILIFVAVIFMSLVIMGMRFRDELEILDVIVLILTMMIAMSLLVIT